VGRKVTEHRGALLLSHPVAHGCVRDWAELELLWRAALEEARGGGGGGGKGGGEPSPLLLATPAQTPRSAREDAAQRAFESLGVPAVHFAPSATLALYATGRTTGLVLECGEGVSAATPVYEGFGLPHAAVRCDYGGGEVTALLAALLRRAGVAFSTAAERDAVRELKEAAAFVAPEPGAAEAAAAGGAPPAAAHHTLPDGTRLALGAELFRAPEVLFNPALAGSEAPGLGAAVLAAVARCDLDLRRPLLGAVVLAGGGSALRGLPARVLAEVRRGAPADARVRVWAPADRKLLTWLGGSILGSLSTFRGMLVTREQWDEEGPEALHRRGTL
jgi:centractin